MIEGASGMILIVRGVWFHTTTCWDLSLLVLPTLATHVLCSMLLVYCVYLQEVSCVGLVALQPLSEGTEILFNYRLSPSLLGRPAWYVPVDSREENMRWA